MIRKTLAAALAAALFAPFAGHAQEAEVTANVGWLSDYYYRGIPQEASSASAGLDVAIGTVSLGTWAADVGDGAEIDIYGSVGLDVADNVSLSVGGTGYFYTGQFDDTYLEANLGLGLGPISLEYSFGQYGNFDLEALDYSFVAVTVENEGAFAALGAFGTDMVLQDVLDAGRYVEVGYGFSAAELDIAISGSGTTRSCRGRSTGVGPIPTSSLS